MKRLLTILLIVASVISVTAGCSDENGTTAEVSVAEVGEHIGQAVRLDDMKQGNLEKLTKLFNLGDTVVEDFVLYTATSNVKADELVVIEVKDASKVDVVLDSIQKRIEAQTVKFQDYRPEEYYLIEKHVLETRGRFILFAVSAEADRIGEAFDEVLR